MQYLCGWAPWKDLWHHCSSLLPICPCGQKSIFSLSVAVKETLPKLSTGHFIAINTVRTINGHNRRRQYQKCVNINILGHSLYIYMCGSHTLNSDSHVFIFYFISYSHAVCLPSALWGRLAHTHTHSQLIHTCCTQQSREALPDTQPGEVFWTLQEVQ